MLANLGYLLAIFSALLVLFALAALFGTLWLLTGPNDFVAPEWDDTDPLGNERGQPV